MGVIIRTAGLERNKAEIKRDFEYLIRAWDEVREKTMLSTAPDMVYEEGDIIKRAIRDLYSKDIDEIIVRLNTTGGGEAASQDIYEKGNKWLNDTCYNVNDVLNENPIQELDENTCLCTENICVDYFLNQEFAMSYFPFLILSLLIQIIWYYF